MRKIRVLIVDDSVVVRRLISDVLASDPAVEVAGIAPTGRIALAKIPQLNPDLVTLDVEMPDMDGLATLRELRKRYPKLPVIMFSTLTERGASVTVDALTSGANDYVAKPANVGSVTASMDQVRESLIPKIKALCSAKIQAEFPGAAQATHAVAPAPAARPASATHVTPVYHPAAVHGRVNILAIGTSTGGPNALAAVLTTLPGNLPVPIVIVQHMPPMFTRMLAEHLTAKCAFKVHEAVEGDRLKAGEGWIAPGNYHMVVVNEADGHKVRLNQNPPENSCRPAVDVLFRSVAEVYRQNVLGVVMTGMGYDGLRGSENIRGNGGSVVVQDEASSVVWGMAGSVAKAGLADGAWPLDQLGSVILKRLQAARPEWIPGRTPIPNHL